MRRRLASGSGVVVLGVVVLAASATGAVAAPSITASARSGGAALRRPVQIPRRRRRPLPPMRVACGSSTTSVRSPASRRHAPPGRPRTASSRSTVTETLACLAAACMSSSPDGRSVTLPPARVVLDGARTTAIPVIVRVGTRVPASEVTADEPPFRRPHELPAVGYRVSPERSRRRSSSAGLPCSVQPRSGSRCRSCDGGAERAHAAAAADPVARAVRLLRESVAPRRGPTAAVRPGLPPASSTGPSCPSRPRPSPGRARSRGRRTPRCSPTASSERRLRPDHIPLGDARGLRPPDRGRPSCAAGRRRGRGRSPPSPTRGLVPRRRRAAVVAPRHRRAASSSSTSRPASRRIRTPGSTRRSSGSCARTAPTGSSSSRTSPTRRYRRRRRRGSSGRCSASSTFPSRQPRCAAAGAPQPVDRGVLRGHADLDRALARPRRDPGQPARAPCRPPRQRPRRRRRRHRARQPGRDRLSARRHPASRRRAERLARGRGIHPALRHRQRLVHARPPAVDSGAAARHRASTFSSPVSPLSSAVALAAFLLLSEPLRWRRA